MTSPVLIPLRPSDITRFWGKVVRFRPAAACWEWQGKRDKDGYGVFYIRSREYIASRVAFTLAQRPLRPGELVCHACDNPPCCNPAHLRADTPSGNVLDRVLRHRHWHGLKRLTAEQRALLAALLASGASVQAIGRQLGCSPKTVRYHLALRHRALELQQKGTADAQTPA